MVTHRERQDPRTNQGEGDIYVIMQSDATQAYCQADLGGNPTWIRLPQNRWPESWRGYWGPVCRPVKALYGHPNSGCYWEQRCKDKAIKEGFRRVGDCGEWRSCNMHEALGGGIGNTR